MPSSAQFPVNVLNVWFGALVLSWEGGEGLLFQLPVASPLEKLEEKPPSASLPDPQLSESAKKTRGTKTNGVNHQTCIYS